MTQVVLDDLTYAFSTPLFERLRASFDVGWTGLVGANGSGKTTLLRLIVGDLEPNQGRVQLPAGARIVWCRQQSRDQRAELERFAEDESAPAQRWRGLLGVRPESWSRFERLSPGERKRWQLAFALGQEPDVLLLDEPTNHLDLQARALLQRALARFGGVGILVSHDRALLDELTTYTAKLGPSGIESCPGNYTASQTQWEARRQARLQAKTELQAERQRLERRLHQQRDRAARAEADRGAGRRMKGPHDQDGRCMLRKNKAEAAGRRLAQDAAALGSRLGRVDRELSTLHVDKQLGAELFAGYVPWPKPTVLRVAFDSLNVGSRRLLGSTTLDVRRNDKLWIRGANGAGKTRLLGEFERQNPHAFARSLYLPQSLSAGVEQGLRESLRALSPDARGRVLNLVAALGSAPAAVLGSAAWSPGETRKVALSLGLAAHAPALILDEPTNHFDLPSIERLERLLLSFPGCVLLVSHDERLAERVATRCVGIERGELLERSLEREG